MRKLLFLTFLILLAGCGQREKVVKPTHLKAHLMMEQTMVEFGTTKQGKVLEHVFDLVNDGSELLYIENVGTYCSCTTVDYPKEPIRPGRSAKMTVHLDTRDMSPGQFHRSFDVYSNSESGKITIILKGEVE